MSLFRDETFALRRTLLDQALMDGVGFYCQALHLFFAALALFLTLVLRRVDARGWHRVEGCPVGGDEGIWKGAGRVDRWLMDGW